MSIYLDYNATAPLRREALDAMRPWLESDFGNPSSTHRLGQKARAALESCRARIAALISAKPSEIVFTSGGTEAINLALRGSPAAHFRIQTARSEHHATLRTAEALQALGSHLEYLEVDGQGAVRAHPPKGGMVSLMHANNETGVLHPIAELSRLAHEHGALFHCDAVQSFGKVELNVEELGADFCSVSAHKFGGPKGAGFLYAKDGVRLLSLLTGGEQEKGLVAGTQNIAAIAGMVGAAEAACSELAAEGRRVGKLRDALQARLLELIPGLEINAQAASRLPNTLSILLPGIESDLMIMRLDAEEIFVSAGSACAAGAVEPSHVLKAMGLPDERAKCVLRLSLGKDNDEAQIEAASRVLSKAVQEFQKAGI